MILFQIINSKILQVSRFNFSLQANYNFIQSIHQRKVIKMKLVKVKPNDQIQPFAYSQTQQVILFKLLKKQDMKIIQFLYYADYDLIYQSFQMKHAAYLQKKLTNLSKKQMNQDIFRRFNVISQKNHFKLEKMSIKTDRILSKLQFTWNQNNTLFFHRYYFLKYLQTSKMELLENLQYFISTQQKLIRTESHIIYSIEKAITARQQCLRRLKVFLNKLGPQDIEEYLYVSKHRLLAVQTKRQIKQYQIEGYKINKIVDKIKRNLGKTKFEEFSQLFHQLTKISLLVIELITQWKEYLYSLTSDDKKKKDRIQYYYKQENYLLRMIDDNNFLRKSFLSNYYQFAQKNDPFLFKPVMYIQKLLQNQHYKQAEIPFKQLYLKKIFLPLKEDLAQIISKIKVLTEEFKENIKNRKIFDIQTLNFINNLQLSKLPTLKSLKKQTIQQQNSVVSMKSQTSAIQNLTSSLKFFQTKNNISKSKSYEKTIKSSLIDSNFRVGSSRKLRQTLNSQQKIVKEEHKFTYLDHEILKKIKSQITQKVKEDLNLNQFSSTKVSKLLLNPQIADHIDAQLNQMMKKTLYNKILTTNNKISILPITIEEEKVDSFLSSIIKQTALKYKFMHKPIQQIRQNILQKQSIYFLKVISLENTASKNLPELQKSKVISHLIFKIDFDYITKKRHVQVLFVSFQTLEELEQIILKTVEFLFKYQNTSEISFPLYYFPQIQQQKDSMKKVKQFLSKNCICLEKRVVTDNNSDARIYKLFQVKFIFKRKNKISNNIQKISCSYPKHFHIATYALMAEESFQINSKSLSTSLTQFNFDYLLAQIIKNHLISQDFLMLRSKNDQRWQHHLKSIIQNILIFKQIQKFPYITTINAGNLTQLNRFLAQQQNSLHIKNVSPSISDKTKHNNIKLFKFQLTLTIGFLAKSLVLGNGQKYHRYEVNNYLSVRKYENQIKVYVLPSYEKKNIKILITQIKKNQQTFKQTLNICGKFQQDQQFVQYLWIPMCRYPDQYSQHQQFFMSMGRPKLNFESIKKQLLVGYNLQWEDQINLQNGINYQIKKKDLILKKPLGLAVVLEPQQIFLMSTVVKSKQIHKQE